jgi:hypothetical protein
MLNLIGSIVGMTVIALNITVFTRAMPAGIRTWPIAAIAGAWVGLASGVGATGQLGVVPGQPVPLIGVLFAVPLLVTGVLATVAKSARTALLEIPTRVLVGLNGSRVLGVLFLLLAAAGQLGGPFPYCAGIGDMITGAVAFMLVRRMWRGEEVATGTIRAWNWFGLLDLLLAVTLGMTSANGSPLQLIHAGAGSEAVQHLPYCLIPTVLVPFYLITHAVVAAQMGRRARSLGISESAIGVQRSQIVA